MFPTTCFTEESAETADATLEESAETADATTIVFFRHASFARSLAQWWSKAARSRELKATIATAMGSRWCSKKSGRSSATTLRKCTRGFMGVWLTSYDCAHESSRNSSISPAAGILWVVAGPVLRSGRIAVELEDYAATTVALVLARTGPGARPGGAARGSRSTGVNSGAIGWRAGIHGWSRGPQVAGGCGMRIGAARS